MAHEFSSVQKSKQSRTIEKRLPLKSDGSFHVIIISDFSSDFVMKRGKYHKNFLAIIVRYIITDTK